MAAINKIRIAIRTGDEDNAGTDGDVYLGFCGREFCLDSSGDDFERASVKEYLFGEGGNTTNKAENDPRQPRLLEENMELFPVYIRFQPNDRDDKWLLKDARVTINDSSVPLYLTSLGQVGLWMGVKSALFAYLQKSIFSD